MDSKNFNLIKQKFPYLINQLSQVKSQPDLLLEICQSKTGLPVARVTRNNRRVFLNSAYDPELEAARWVDSGTEQDSGCCILYGAGFFYHIKALLASTHLKKLIIYEPSPVILQAALNEIDLEPLGKYPNFLLLTGTNYEELVGQVLGFFDTDLKFSSTELQVKTLTGYSELFGEEIGIFQEKLRQLIRMLQVNLSTTDFFAEKWLSNAFATFSNAVNSPVIRHYFGQFRNTPAIIVSAGPSLENNVRQINQIKEKALVICAGTSMRAMKHHGVSPHFLVAIDGGDVNTGIYGDLDLADVCLVYNFRFWHGMASKFPGRKILMKVDAESLPDLFITQNGGYEVGTIRSGFSCAHTALDLAFKLGCNPIIFIGQDLAYSAINPKRYAEGQIHYSAYDVLPGQLPPQSFITKDIYGQNVITDYQLDSFRILFQHMIGTIYQGKVNLINATEGGQHIQGTTDRKLAEVIVEYCQEDRQISQRIESLYERGLHEIRSHPIDHVAFCSRLKSMTNRAIIKMSELIDRLQALRKQNFSIEYLPGQWDQSLDRITADYNLALNFKEYHLLLKDIQATTLSINKARLNAPGEIKTSEDFDHQLQIYLSIIADTQQALEFVQDCIAGVLKQSENDTPPTQVVEESLDVAALEIQIKQRTNLPELQRTLELAVKNQAAVNHGANLYLYGLILAQVGQTAEAVDRLTEAVKIDSTLAKAYFLLFKFYYQSRNTSKALELLENCCRLRYKTVYCRKMQLKINYQAHNWVTVNNLVTDYAPELSGKKALFIVQVECLCRLNLNLEAQKSYQNLISNSKIPNRVDEFLQKLLEHATKNLYEQMYQANQQFFQDTLGLTLPPYAAVQYKVCRFLSSEFVYDNQSSQIMPGVNQAQPIEMSISPADSLVIYNTYHTKIFDYLMEILSCNQDINYQKYLRRIPIYIIEDDLKNWCFLAQLFDFNRLQEWENLHYHIAPGIGGMERIFMEEEAPWPKIFYGTTEEKFTQLMAQIRQAKDEVLQGRQHELDEYYQILPKVQAQKVLVISSIKEDVLLYYSKALQVYLNETGIDCRLHIESAPYFCFTPYGDAKLLDEFRPDLVIHLFAIQEELEVFNLLAVPFISWLWSERQFSQELRAFCPNQTVLNTGNLNVKNILISKGYRDQQITTVPLPVFPAKPPAISTNLPTNGIGIFGDLEDLDEIIKNLQEVIYGFIMAKTDLVDQQSIVAALKTVYFQMYTHQHNEDLDYHPLSVYEKVLEESLARYNINLAGDELKFTASFVRNAFDSLFFHLVQVKWVIHDLQNHGIALYGTGWAKEPAFRPFYKGEINSVTKPAEFQQVVLQNKVNLYLGTQLNNKSYMQPDLIQGIAVGGFFMTSDLLTKEYGVNTVEPFNGLLDLYGSQREMLEKLNYFLSHNDERLTRTKMLQNHGIENFGIAKILQPQIVQPKPVKTGF